MIGASSPRVRLRRDRRGASITRFGGGAATSSRTVNRCGTTGRDRRGPAAWSTGALGQGLGPRRSSASAVKQGDVAAVPEMGEPLRPIPSAESVGTGGDRDREIGGAVPCCRFDQQRSRHAVPERGGADDRAGPPGLEGDRNRPHRLVDDSSSASPNGTTTPRGVDPPSPQPVRRACPPYGRCRRRGRSIVLGGDERRSTELDRAVGLRPRRRSPASVDAARHRSSRSRVNTREPMRRFCSPTPGRGPR